MSPLHILLLLFLPLNILLLDATPSPHPHPDLPPLLSFKSHLTDPLNALSTWTPTSPTPCNFTGVTCSPTTSRVTKLVLESFSLTLTNPSSLPIPLLAPLSSLKLLSLKHNSLSGSLPPFPPLPSLKLLFLSHNSLSGPLPSTLPLPSLYRLDLSHNSLSGPIPPSLPPSLPHLLTLRLELNSLSGTLSPLSSLTTLQDFNVSSNRLEGAIPPSLSIFSSSAFSDNAALCGHPLLATCRPDHEPIRPGGGNGDGNENSTVVSSTPSDVPLKTDPLKNSKRKSRIGVVAILVIILADAMILGVISVLLYCYFCRGKGEEGEARKSRKNSAVGMGERVVYSSSYGMGMSPYNNNVGGGEGSGKMVFFSGERRFELEDLLKASAEMLGKGTLGTAYKAVLDDGSVVAVKRLKEMQVGGGGGRKEFEGLMEVLGGLRHPSLVGLKAYYFARDEKLLVFEYLVNGSLFWLLHGN